VLGGDPSVPFLATAPLNVAARPARRWRWGVAVAAAALGTAAIVILIAVPVAQSATESVTLANPNGSILSVTETLSFPHAGTFDFSWQKISGKTSSFDFTVVAPTGKTVFERNYTAGGSGSLKVTATGPYTFEIYDWLSGTMTVTGKLHYDAPLL